MTVQTQTMITIPVDEYQRLKSIEESLENQRDLEAYRETRGQESIPWEMSESILDGESPLRLWREHRNFTLQDLATKAEISISYLSEIETGKKDGSLRVMKRVADALQVELDDLI